MKLEGSQRIAFQTMKSITEGFISESLRFFVVFFPKIHSKDSVLAVLNKFDTIHKNIDDDKLTVKALELMVCNFSL